VSPFLLLLALLGASGPCELPEPLGAADPAAAAPYLEVAEEERAAGALETALAAYQEALRHDPTSAQARAGLESVCAAQSASGDEALARALELLDAGEPEAALKVLAAEPGTAGNPAAALLEGLARLALGEDEAAVEALRAAHEAPGTAPAAALYLGILSLRRGEVREAEGLLEAAASASDPRISQRASALLPHAQREGRLSVSVRVGADYDSNVDLAPNGVPQLEGSADLALGGVAALVFQPLGPSGPFLRAVAHARRHRRFYGLDLWGAGAEAGWAHERPWLALSTALGLDYAALGGAPYLWAPRFEVAARGLQGPWVLEAQGELRWEDFAEPAFADYSGPYASGRLGFAWQPLSGRMKLGLAYGLGYQGARVQPLAALEHGPRAELWVRPYVPLRVGLSVAGGWRRSAAFDPALSARREDGFAEAVLALEHALWAYWSVQAQLSGQLARSNVPRFSTERWVGGLALVGSIGLF
jgi:tetratricopeptide (TPR) repeat protein